MTLVFAVIFVALVFEYINGFHDTANSIATVVSTKVLTPRQAVVMAACTNLLGALLGTAVAKTIAGGLVETTLVTLSSGVIICALIGAIVAEFFGTPTQGIGFRISTEVGRMSLDMVWAEIALAAIAGMAFYGLVALAERVTTFWHPSYRT